MAALGVAVLVIAIVALRHPNGRIATAGSTHSVSSSPAAVSPTETAPTASTSTATTSAPRTTPAPSSTSRTAVTRLPLIVLNNTTTNGLATRAAASFRAGGWTVTDIDNLHNDIISTCAYYDPAVAGAQTAAQALRAQFPAIKRVAPKFDGLPAGPIVVVLTTDYPAG